MVGVRALRADHSEQCEDTSRYEQALSGWRLMGYACGSCIEEKIKEAKLVMLDTDLSPEERLKRVSELMQEA